MQPVLRLVEDDAPRSVHHVGRDLLAAMGREAVHHERLGRDREQVPVHLERGEGVTALFRLGLVAHRRPRVGIDDGGPLDRLARVAGEGEAPAGGRCDLRRSRDDPLVRAVPDRVREADLHAEGGTHQRQRMVDVVAVADEGEHGPPQVSEPLVEGEQVRQGLAGVLADGQPVDHRDRGPGGQLRHDLVGTGPGHDAVDEALEVARHVADGLPPAEDDALGEVDRMAAELGHPGLERDPCPEARLLEQHRERAPLQRRVRVPALGQVLRLEIRGAGEQPLDLGCRQVGGADEIASPKRVCAHGVTLPGRRISDGADPVPTDLPGRRISDGADGAPSARRLRGRERAHLDVRERAPAAGNAAGGRQVRAVSAWCTGVPCGRASARTSCAPSSAGPG